MRPVDYHTHTPLCGHASGTPEEYIRAAVDRSFAEIGFSDHAPLPESMREGITMRPEDAEKYISAIEAGRDHFRDTIPVKLGFEIDYPLQPSFDRRFLADPRFDYLIGSCHYIDGWGFDHPREAAEFEKRDIDAVYADYYRIMYDLVRSGMFNIVGHFDLVKKFGHRAKGAFRTEIARLAAECARRDIAVEINTAGLRKPVGEIYPSDYIIEILFEHNTPVTLGSDAHEPGEIGYAFDAAIEKLRKAGYTKISGFSKRRRYDILL